MELEFEYVRHAETGLLVAYCRQHPGIMAHGRTMPELEERIPEAIKAVLNAEGKKVQDVVRVGDDDVSGSGFMPSSGRFSAALAA